MNRKNSDCTHTWVLVFILIACFLMLQGCGPGQPLEPLKPAPIAEGSDRLVVQSERAVQVAFETYKATVEYDRRNLEAIKTLAPAVHETVQGLRREFPNAYRDARLAIAEYKKVRTPAAADVMNQKVTVVQQKESVARKAFTDAQQARP